jgi:Domain of unknown function (DUF4270)
MTNTNFLRKGATIVVVLFFLSFFISCDKDYNTIGSDVVGGENFNFESISPPVIAFNQKVDAVQTNNLPINQLGVYNSDVFGKTTANFVTQLSLAATKPTFTSHVVIDSVVLTVPYFSKFKSTDANGVNTYELDSIYKSATNPEIDLKVYENGYYLRDFDPNDNLNPQKYYSNQDSDFDAVKVGSHLNNSVITAENTLFFPSNREYVKYKVDPATLTVPATGKEVESRIAPRMRLHLDNAYFKTRIMDPAIAASPDFESNNAFKSYFRGLYFKVLSGSTGNMTSIDFSKGDVTIYYKQDKVVNTGTISTNPADREMKTLVLNMIGNSVNLYNNNDNPTYSTAITTASAVNGDKKLYIKGGQGATAFIDLPATLRADYKDKKWLINEANLTFTIDNVAMGTAQEPQRIYVYNVDKNRPIIDYFLDSSSNTLFPKLNRFVHGGIIEKEKTAGGRGIKYKVRITEHINNIINKDSSNVRLGIVVTENINDVRSSYLKTPVNFTTPLVKKFSRVPLSSGTSPLGTVLWGTSPDVAPENRIKLNIYYTKPN